MRSLRERGEEEGRVLLLYVPVPSALLLYAGIPRKIALLSEADVLRLFGRPSLKILL